jgi:two-component system sensor histidine kinase BarA
MVALLEQRGAATTVASNGLEALSKLEQQDYDLVFMDVEMPGLDGIEVTKRIRDKETGVAAGRTRIVGLSAHAFQEDRKLAIQAGMDDYLTKPVNITDLDRVLTEGMDYKRARQR